MLQHAIEDDSVAVDMTAGHSTTTRARYPVQVLVYLRSLQQQLSATSLYFVRECFVLPSYLRAACWGYSCGVIVAMVVARSFHVAQPALLYIVPATLIPVMVRAFSLGLIHRNLIWSGDDRILNESASASAAPHVALMDSDLSLPTAVDGTSDEAQAITRPERTVIARASNTVIYPAY
jgi:hypothetical protein